MDWAKNDDTGLRAELVDLAQRLDRMRRIKRGGISALPTEVAASTNALVENLAAIGVFLVPVGELEEWLSGESISASKQRKSAWANEASAKVRQLGTKEGDVWDFMRRVAGFLSDAVESTSS
jgi:hypothetical protein